MINCFIPFLSLPQARQTVRALGLCDRIKNIYLLATEKIPDEVEGCEMLMIDSPASTATFRTIALHADTAYTLLYGIIHFRLVTHLYRMNTFYWIAGIKTPCYFYKLDE